MFNVFNSDLLNRTTQKGASVQASRTRCALPSSESLIVAVSFALSPSLESLLNLPAV